MEQPEQDAEVDFATTLANVRACTLCAGLPLGPKPILQVDPRARILIAGQAPGRITHHKGIPFDDPSGDRLRDWLGVDRRSSPWAFASPALARAVICHRARNARQRGAANCWARSTP